MAIAAEIEAGVRPLEREADRAFIGTSYERWRRRRRVRGEVERPEFSVAVGVECHPVVVVAARRKGEAGPGMEEPGLSLTDPVIGGALEIEDVRPRQRDHGAR